jgi:cytochrome c5
MSSENKDYFTEMVKLMMGLGVIALVVVFGLRLVIGAFSSDSTSADQQAINDRLKSIETVSLVGEPLPSMAAAPKAKVKESTPAPVATKAPAAKSETAAVSGEQLYKAKCVACHASGVAGAPVFGNKEQWAPRIAKGMDVLMETALNGSKANPAMLPKGGATDLTDAQVKSIVEYMVNGSK